MSSIPKKPEDKVTPRPWVALGSSIEAEDGSVVCALLDPNDAAHIVRCVNIHNELVELLGRIQGIATDSEASKQDRLDHIETLVKMALAKAQGGVE